MKWSRESARTYRLQGRIVSAGFDSGDRLVVGIWQSGPLGPMNDIMWVDPFGNRTLVAPDERVAEFVSSLYSFESVHISPVHVGSTHQSVHVTCDRIEMTAALGQAIPIPLRRLRTPTLTRFIEGPISRRFLGVSTYGQARNGVEEWYQADAVRRIRTASASIDGNNLGPLRNLRPALNVGFSEPPKTPSCVDVRPLLRDASGALDVLFRS